MPVLGGNKNQGKMRKSIQLISFILFILSYRVYCSNEIHLYATSEDSIWISVEDSSNNEIIKKTYKFYYGSIEDKEKFDFIDVLWKERNDFEVYSKVYTDLIYILDCGISVKATDLSRFYLSKKWLNDSWEICLVRKPRDSITYKGLALKIVTVTLSAVNYFNNDTLYTFAIDDNTDLTEEYTYDQNLNLEKIVFRYSGMINKEKIYEKQF